MSFIFGLVLLEKVDSGHATYNVEQSKVLPCIYALNIDGSSGVRLGTLLQLRARRFPPGTLIVRAMEGKYWMTQAKVPCAQDRLDFAWTAWFERELSPLLTMTFRNFDVECHKEGCGSPRRDPLSQAMQSYAARSMAKMGCISGRRRKSLTAAVSYREFAVPCLDRVCVAW